MSSLAEEQLGLLSVTCDAAMQEGGGVCTGGLGGAGSLYCLENSLHSLAHQCHFVHALHHHCVVNCDEPRSEGLAALVQEVASEESSLVLTESGSCLNNVKCDSSILTGFSPPCATTPILASNVAGDKKHQVPKTKLQLFRMSIPRGALKGKTNKIQF